MEKQWNSNLKMHELSMKVLEEMKYIDYESLLQEVYSERLRRKRRLNQAEGMDGSGEGRIISPLEKRKALARIYIKKIKSKTGCEQCGESREACLDFHHKYAKKLYCISSMVGQGRSPKTIHHELRKCITLCSNCHRVLHA